MEFGKHGQEAHRRHRWSSASTARKRTNAINGARQGGVGRRGKAQPGMHFPIRGRVQGSQGAIRKPKSAVMVAKCCSHCAQKLELSSERPGYSFHPFFFSNFRVLSSQNGRHWNNAKSDWSQWHNIGGVGDEALQRIEIPYLWSCQQHV